MYPALSLYLITTSNNKLAVTALHYNNKGRWQAVTNKGTKRVAVQYPKYMKVGYIVIKIVEDSIVSKIPTSSNDVYSFCFMQALTPVFTDDVEDLFGEGYSFVEDPQIATRTCLASPPSV